MYKVKESDLVGDLEGFPIEVVQKMIEWQEEQGNEEDVSVFRRYRGYGTMNGGFDWEETEEGEDFWNDVVYNRNFDTFFKKYPKENKEENMAHVIKENESIKNDRKDDKLRWDLLSLPLVEWIVKVCHFGAKKYKANSWQELDDGYNRYKAAMLRHITAYEKREFYDKESGLPHLAHAAWNSLAMLYFGLKEIENKNK